HQIEVINDRGGERRTFGKIGLDRPTLQEERDFLVANELLDLFVTRLGNPADLRTLEVAQFTDPMTMLLLEQRVIDASREYLHVDDGALDTGRHLQRRILHVL